MLNSKFIVGAEGFEPPMFTLWDLIYSQAQHHQSLPYSVCDPGGTWTHDPLFKRQVHLPTELQGQYHIESFVTRRDSNPCAGIKDIMCFPLLYQLSYWCNRCVYSLHYLPQLLTYLTNAFPILMPVRPCHLLTFFMVAHAIVTLKFFSPFPISVYIGFHSAFTFYLFSNKCFSQNNRGIKRFSGVITVFHVTP